MHEPTCQTAISHRDVRSTTSSCSSSFRFAPCRCATRCIPNWLGWNRPPRSWPRRRLHIPFLSGTSLPDLPEAEYITESGGGDGLSSDPCVNPNPYQDPTSKKEKRHFLKMPGTSGTSRCQGRVQDMSVSQTWISPQVTCQRQTGDFGARDWLWLSLCAPK